MAASENIVQSRRALYVGGIGEGVNQTTLRAAMIPFGPIKSVDIVSFCHHFYIMTYLLLLFTHHARTHTCFRSFRFQPMDYQKGLIKGFAFVEFDDPEDAAEAIFNMDGAELMGRTLHVSLAQPNQMSLSSHQAVWSTDEWFQQQAGLDNKVDQENREATQHDQSALKNQIPIP
jgi:peptidyl-prolyl isomerase E (cyclophilin E)